LTTRQRRRRRRPRNNRRDRSNRRSPSGYRHQGDGGSGARYYSTGDPSCDYASAAAAAVAYAEA